MEGFTEALAYCLFITFAAFPIGRALPKRWFRFDSFPYRSIGIERGGEIYTRLGIRSWMNKVPDASRVFPKLMIPKAMPDKLTSERLDAMLCETCIAEAVHTALAVASLGCINICSGVGGYLIAEVSIFVGNLPFIIIQRYTRPKLARLRGRVAEREKRVAGRTER